MKGIIPAALFATQFLMGQFPLRFNRPPTPEAQVGPVVGKPFSATEIRRTTDVLNDGTHVDEPNTGLFYRDGEGRMRDQSSTTVMVYDPVARFYARFGNDGKQTCWKNTIPANSTSGSIAVVGNQTSWGSGRARMPAAGGAAQQVTEDLGEQVINGVNAKSTRVTVTIPAGTFGNDQAVRIVNERWFSDELQALVKSSSSDPRFGVTTYELTNIAQGAPDPALFEIPSGRNCGSGPFQQKLGVP